ncbi:MAG: GNAT family N-acetyltransferase [Vallitaleaceae bacterium]|nr:GNAT family N-acetyltransferase [Vallitaleaceae bacterium]
MKISVINPYTYGRIIDLYNSIIPRDDVALEEELIDDIYRVLTKQEQMVIHDDHWAGFIILFQKGEKVTVNPWVFGGMPITAKSKVLLKSELLTQAIDYCKTHGIKKIISVQNRNALKDHNLFIDNGFTYDYDYCDMELKLTDINLSSPEAHGSRLSPKTKILNINDAKLIDLKQLYHMAFQASDAWFYKDQTADEKRAFFDFLGYAEALDEPGSICVYHEEQLIGFTFVIGTDEPDVKHFSCMCVSPDFRGKGFGRIMLDEIIVELKKQHVKKIALGTEAQMQAFALYQSRGFKVTGTSSYYHMLLTDYEEGFS